MIWIEYICENYENKMDQALNYNIMPWILSRYNGTSVKLILPKYPQSISHEYVSEFQEIPVNSVPCPRVRCRGTFRRRWQRSRCGRWCWRPQWSPGPAPGNTYRPTGSYTTAPSSRSSQNSTRSQSHLYRPTKRQSIYLLDLAKIISQISDSEFSFYPNIWEKFFNLKKTTTQMFAFLVLSQ